MYQLIKSIELEPRNKMKDTFIFLMIFKTDNIDFLKTFKNGTDNKILRFNRNFQIFSGFGNVVKRGVKFFSISNNKKRSNGFDYFLLVQKYLTKKLILMKV